MKKWLLPLVVIVFGLSSGYGQAPGPAAPGEGGGPPLEGKAEPKEGPVIEGIPPLLGPPEYVKEKGGKRRAMMRAFREKIRAVKLELDLLNREIREGIRQLKELQEELSGTTEQSEEARIKKEIQGILNKLSQYEILLSEKKVEISRKAYERSLERYIKAKVELEVARRKSKFRRKWLKERSKEKPGPLPILRRPRPAAPPQPREGEGAGSHPAGPPLPGEGGEAGPPIAGPLYPGGEDGPGPPAPDI